MKKYLLFFYILTGQQIVLSQGSRVYDNLSMTSKILGMERKYAVYLPDGYESSQRSYPVLYLLHGGGDDQTGWIQFGEVQHITDSAIAAGLATSMIVVMPDASAGKRGFYNSANNTWRYEDFFFQELLPKVEKIYRIKAEKRYRAIAGLSMGGDGAFTYALHHPELFSSACPLSAGGFPLSLDDAKMQFAKDSPRITNKDILDFYTRQSILNMVNTMPDSMKNSVRWFIGCGDDDHQYELTSLIHIAMRKKGIMHELRITDGGHNWTYWRSQLPMILQFVSQSFHQY